MTDPNLNKLRDILSCTCSGIDHNGNSWNNKTQSYDPCDCVDRLPALQAMLREARVDELQIEKEHFKNAISFYAGRLDEYINDRIEQLHSTGEVR